MRNPAAKGYVYLQARKLRHYEDRMVGRFDTNLTVSARDRDLLLERVPAARVDVIPNGVDTEYFQASNGEQAANSLIFVGGLTWFPNYDAITYFNESIWPLIRARLPDATLTLVGRMPSGFDTSRLPAGIDARGFVDDIRPLVANAAAFIVPLRVGGGTRLKILDALAMGKAIVSTSIGCEGIDVTPGENILVGDSPEDFTNQVVRVCQDAPLRNSLGREGRKLVEEKYAWKLIGSRLTELLESVRV
jgi:glycosyltransferase involved in cell wall biosynthesis